VKTIRSIIQSANRRFPLKETFIALLSTFILLIIMEAVWRGSVSHYINMKFVAFGGGILGYIAICIVVVEYIIQYKGKGADNAESPGLITYAVNKMIRALPSLLLILPVIILLLIALDYLWEGSISGHIDIIYLVIGVIVSEFMALFIVLIKLNKPGRYRRSPDGEEAQEPTAAVSDSGENAESMTGPVAQADSGDVPSPAVEPVAPPIESEEVVVKERGVPPTPAGRISAGSGKTGTAAGIVRKLAAPLSNLFLCLLVAYLLLLLAETVWEGSVSGTINLNYLLIAVIAVGVPAVLFGPKRAVASPVESLGWKDFTVAAAAAAGGSAIVWYKTQGIGWASYVIAAVTAALIAVLYLLISREGDESEDSENSQDR